MSDVVYVKMFGCKRTGTNVVQYILDEQTNATPLVHHGQWKHSTPYRDFVSDEKMRGFDIELTKEMTHEFNTMPEGKQYNLFCIKNPYAWYLSMSKYNNWDHTEWGSHVIQRWIDNNTDYVKYILDNPDHSQYILHDDLIRRPQEVFDEIGSSWEIDVDNDIKLPDHSMGREGEPSNNHFNKKKYTERQYLDILDDQIINKITQELDEFWFDILGMMKP